MNIVVDKQPKCAATLRVEVPADKVSSIRNQITLKYAKHAKIPGFRPGKAPRAIVEKRYSKEISDELQDQLINEAFETSVRQESLKVIQFGEPTDITTTEDGSFSFSSTITLAPEFSLPEYKGIAITIPSKTVPQDEIDQQLKALQERFADFKTIEGRALAMGDFAVIDYSSNVNGQPTDEFVGKSAGYISGRSDFWIRLSDDTFLPGFAAQIVGMNPGESRDVTVTIPSDFPMEALRDQALTISTTLKEIKESILPELNDEFAAKLIPDATLATLTEVIVTNLTEERSRRIDDYKVEQIVKHFNSIVDCELPEGIVQQEAQNQAQSMIQSKIQSGNTDDLNFEDIMDQARSSASTNVRTNFILQEIANAEKISATDQELVSHLVQVATSRKVSPKKFIRDLQRAGRLQSVRQSLIIGKTIDFLVENASVTESADLSLNDA